MKTPSSKLKKGLSQEKEGKTMKQVFIGEYGLDQVGQTVEAIGWIANIRNHGKLAFIELRDREGLLQIFVDNSIDDFEKLHELHRETIISVTGQVVERASRFINKSIKSGYVELKAQKIDIISTSQPLPFDLDSHTHVGEEIRQKYRYLDLRRQKMTENLKLRHLVSQTIRDYLNAGRFIDVETPYLTKSTPEGARDFLVPSRVFKNQFYALPQSPQMLKQLLMGAGLERYYQIVRCFRDEDLRGDRQPEFTQVDLEMSFATEEDIKNLVEGMLKAVIKVTHQLELTDPFPQLTYKEAMQRFGSDKPDTRFDMELKDLTTISRDNPALFLQKGLSEDGAAVIGFCAKAASNNFSKRQMAEFKDLALGFGIKSFATAPIENGMVAGNLKSTFKKDNQKIIDIFEAENGDLLFLATGPKKAVQEGLGTLRIHIAKLLDLIDPERLDFLWVTDWPLLEWNGDSERYQAVHHPFTQGAFEDAKELKEQPEAMMSHAYDIVLNGYEIGGGSLRIHDRKTQEIMFELLGMTKEEYLRDFGFFLEALDYGFPPHGGLALGLDRLIMILAGEDNIREVIAFPKNGSGADPMLESPNFVSSDQLADLKIDIIQ